MKKTNKENIRFSKGNETNIILIVCIVDFLYEIGLLIIFINGILDSFVVYPSIISIILGVILSYNILMLFATSIIPTFPIGFNSFLKDPSRQIELKYPFLNKYTNHIYKIVIVHIISFAVFLSFTLNISAENPIYPPNYNFFPGDSKIYIQYKIIYLYGTFASVISILSFVTLIHKTQFGTVF